MFVYLNYTWFWRGLWLFRMNLQIYVKRMKWNILGRTSFLLMWNRLIRLSRSLLLLCWRLIGKDFWRLLRGMIRILRLFMKFSILIELKMWVKRLSKLVISVERIILILSVIWWIITLIRILLLLSRIIIRYRKKDKNL